MPHRYHELTFTRTVKAAQTRLGSRGAYARQEDQPALLHARLGPEEVEFIAARDHFFIASVSETGWPYVQHRGGPPGFLRVLEPTTLALPDYRGNRQYITLGNLAHDDRVSLFLIDYPARRRLKLLGPAREVQVGDGTALARQLAPVSGAPRAERALLIQVEAFDWNCPKYITPRFTEEEVRTATAPLLERIEQLEAENVRLRSAANAALDAIPRTR